MVVQLRVIIRSTFLNEQQHITSLVALLKSLLFVMTNKIALTALKVVYLILGVKLVIVAPRIKF